MFPYESVQIQIQVAEKVPFTKENLLICIIHTQRALSRQFLQRVSCISALRCRLHKLKTWCFLALSSSLMSIVLTTLFHLKR